MNRLYFITAGRSSTGFPRLAERATQQPDVIHNTYVGVALGREAAPPAASATKPQEETGLLAPEVALGPLQSDESSGPNIGPCSHPRA